MLFKSVSRWVLKVVSRRLGYPEFSGIDHLLTYIGEYPGWLRSPALWWINRYSGWTYRETIDGYRFTRDAVVQDGAVEDDTASGDLELPESWE